MLPFFNCKLRCSIVFWDVPLAMQLMGWRVYISSAFLHVLQNGQISLYSLRHASECLRIQLLTPCHSEG